jgi:hypothetical protein
MLGNKVWVPSRNAVCWHQTAQTGFGATKGSLWGLLETKNAYQLAFTALQDCSHLLP